MTSEGPGWYCYHYVIERFQTVEGSLQVYHEDGPPPTDEVHELIEIDAGDPPDEQWTTRYVRVCYEDAQ